MMTVEQMLERRRAEAEAAKPKMNGYRAYYRGSMTEVWATGSYEAQRKAAAKFRAKKAYDVTVVLCVKDGETVSHSTAEFG